MGWRSVIITQPAYLSLGDHALQIRQGDNKAHVPLEDVSVLLIDNPQVTLTGQLLSACAEQQIILLTMDASHHPNGMLLPFTPHSRALKVMRAQLGISQPLRKRLHQQLIRQKLLNQARVLGLAGKETQAELVTALAAKVRSGDPDNHEAQAAQRYFPALFGAGFLRSQDIWINSALNYGYAVLRAAIARALVAYGFLPAFGLFHRSELNAFNLADDLIEPYRPYVDHLAKQRERPAGEGLSRDDKNALVALLHEDIETTQHDGGRCTLLSAIDATVMSLSRVMQSGELNDGLVLPLLTRPHHGEVDIP